MRKDLFLFLLLSIFLAANLDAQTDIDYNNPKEYTIADITVEGSFVSMCAFVNQQVV